MPPKRSAAPRKATATSSKAGGSSRGSVKQSKGGKRGTAAETSQGKGKVGGKEVRNEAKEKPAAGPPKIPGVE
jgi:hypothetical protein